MNKEQRTEIIETLADNLDKESMRDLLLYLANQNKTVQDSVIGFFKGTEELRKAMYEVF